MNDELEYDSNNSDANDLNEKVTRKAVRVLGKRTYNKPKQRRVKCTSNKHPKEYNYDKTINYSKLVKERFLYLPFYPLPDLSEYLGEIIEVRIAAEYLSQENKAFIDKRIWGSEIYTSDSDVVCILHHSGYFKIKELSPTNIEGVCVFFRISKGRTTYNSSYRNGIKSKKTNNFQGHSIKPENYTLVKNLGSKIELHEMASKMPTISDYERKKPIPKMLCENFYQSECNTVFNLSFEMWLHYSIPAIADKGRDIKDFTSWKLKDKTLYIETDDKRYEIARNIIDHTNDDYLFEEYETFRISEVRDHSFKDNQFMIDNSVPLSNEYVKVVYSKLDWHEFQWGVKTLKIRNFEINNLKCFNFYNIK